MHRSICRNSLLILPTLFLLSGCSRQEDGGTDGAASDAPPEVRLALNWYAEVEHGGFIAADHLGLYADAGVKVNVEQGSVGAPAQVIQELASGRLKFGVSNADMVVLARAQGVPLVAVAAPLQHSPRCIMVHESSGITKLEELADLELAISDSRPFALWMKKQLPLTDVTMVPFNGQVGEFLLKDKFAQQGYVFSEPFVAKEKGGDPRVLMVSEIGFDPYSSVLVTTEQVITEEPDLVRAVVQASIAGWKRYLDDPAATNEKIRDLNSDMSSEALNYGVEHMQPLCEDQATSLCGMTEERWRTLVDQITELGEIEPDSVMPDDCFTTEFLTGAAAK